MYMKTNHNQSIRLRSRRDLASPRMDAAIRISTIRIHTHRHGLGFQ